MVLFLLRGQHCSVAALGLVGRPGWLSGVAAALRRALANQVPQAFLTAIVSERIFDYSSCPKRIQGLFHSQRDSLFTRTSLVPFLIVLMPRHTVSAGQDFMGLILTSKDLFYV